METVPQELYKSDDCLVLSMIMKLLREIFFFFFGLVKMDHKSISPVQLVQWTMWITVSVGQDTSAGIQRLHMCLSPLHKCDWIPGIKVQPRLQGCASLQKGTNYPCRCSICYFQQGHTFIKIQVNLISFIVVTIQQRGSCQITNSLSCLETKWQTIRWSYSKWYALLHIEIR